MKNVSPCGRWKTLHLGPLCVSEINRYLGLNLSPGNVVFFWHAQKHSFKNKPHREPICAPHYKSAILNPTHVGQQPNHIGKGFDLVYRSGPAAPIILLGINLKPLKGTLYTVKSAYPIPLDTLERRIRIKTTFEI